MGSLPTPENYARSLYKRTKPPVPLAQQDFLKRIRSQLEYAKKPRCRARFAAPDSMRGSPNSLGFPWIEKRRKKFGALVYVEGKHAGRRVTGPSRPTILEAARDAVAIRRRHKLPIPDHVLSKLDDLEAAARNPAGPA